MTNYTEQPVTHEALLKLAEEINCGPIDSALRSEILSSVIDENLSLFENLPDSVAKSILGEAYDSTMGMPIPSTLMNAGKALDGEMSHQFQKDNACPYYQENELCALDGRICLYDTDTFPVCPRYKQGFTGGIPGLDGKKPTVPPVSEMPKDPASNQPPYNNPFTRG